MSGQHMMHVIINCFGIEIHNRIYDTAAKLQFCFQLKSNWQNKYNVNSDTFRGRHWYRIEFIDVSTERDYPLHSRWVLILKPNKSKQFDIVRLIACV